MSWNAIGSAVSRASSASGAALARAALHLSNRCRLPRRDPAGYRRSARRSRCVRGPAAGRTGHRHPRCRHRLPRRRDPLPAVVRTSAPAAAPAAAETGGEDRQLYTVSKPPAALPSSASAKKESTTDNSAELSVFYARRAADFNPRREAARRALRPPPVSRTREYRKKTFFDKIVDKLKGRCYNSLCIFSWRSPGLEQSARGIYTDIR